MGNQCISSNSIRIYDKELNINSQELKNQWSAIKSYNIKRLFEKVAQKSQSSKETIFISYNGFCQMFPELIRYEEMQKKRIFQIFDKSQNGHVNWHDFYESISICYFGNDKIMATLMFIIFDQLLQKNLDRSQLQLLVDLNANYLRDQSIGGSEMDFQTDFVVEKLLKDDNSISLQKWLERSYQFFDFKQFRRLFNIFKEQKLEKQLVQNFYEWNELFNETQSKYISYIISFKWFQSWKIYVEKQYGISISMEQKNPVTMKSIKTKKSLKTNNSKTKHHITNYKGSIKINEQMYHNQLENDQLVLINNRKSFEVKNYDFIRSKIGERPKKIQNHFLEGEYSGIMKTGLVQNRDYVFVSEKVWSYLNQIYSGQPQFRRTGFEQIELYPKIIRIYSGMFKNEIDYSSQIVREVSNNRSVQDLMIKSLQLDEEYLKDLCIFYRTVGMPAWQQIAIFSTTFGQITQNQTILLAYIEKKSRIQKQFRQKYLNSAKSMKDSILGDILVYEDPIRKIQKQAVFFNRTIEGKYIIHFIGESYFSDICLTEKQFLKSCRINYTFQQVVQTNSKSTKIDKRKRGIQTVKNLSFITATIIQFLQNPELKQFVISLENIKEISNRSIEAKEKTYLSIILAYINRLIKANMKVDPKDLLLLVDIYFGGFKNFNITQINTFISSFCGKLKEQAEILKLPNIIKNEFEFTFVEKIKCLNCECISEESTQNQIIFPLQIPESEEGYYQIIFVPFCLSMTGHSIKRYAFQLPKNSTLKDYKLKFQTVSEIYKRPYALLQIQGNCIVKNFNQVKDQLTLQNLHLRQSDCIYAYELCTDLSVFVRNHFSFTDSENFEIQQKDLKVGDMIDCCSPEKGWIFGKIIDKDIMPYTYQQNLKVFHKFPNNEISSHTYKLMKNIVALFPSQSHKNCIQYHLRVIQRVFSEANNQMINCNMPLVILLASWMRPRQFQYLIYLQIQKFISSEFSFQGQIVHTNFIGSSSIQKNIIREATKIKVKKFKQYLYGKNLPYKLNFIDNNGHCLICSKFVKSVIYKGESENYCEGCSLPNDDPISWQIMIEDLVIAIDWKNNYSFNKESIKNTNSFISLSSKRKKDIETIQSCLDITIKNSNKVSQMLCCNKPCNFLVEKLFYSLPNILIVSLCRTAEENGFKKNISKPIYFGDQNITVQGEEYKLVGIIGSIGHQNNQTYIAYVKQSTEKEANRWLAYNGEKVEIIKKQKIEKRSTHLFFYKKIKSNIDKNKTKSQQNLSEVASLINVNLSQQQIDKALRSSSKQNIIIEANDIFGESEKLREMDIVESQKFQQYNENQFHSEEEQKKQTKEIGDDLSLKLVINILNINDDDDFDNKQ